MIPPIPFDQAIQEAMAHALANPMDPLTPPDNYAHARHTEINGVEYRILFDQVTMPKRNGGTSSAFLLTVGRVLGTEIVRPTVEEVRPILVALGGAESQQMQNLFLNNSVKFAWMRT